MSKLLATGLKPSSAITFVPLQHFGTIISYQRANCTSWETCGLFNGRRISSIGNSLLVTRVKLEGHYRPRCSVQLGAVVNQMAAQFPGDELWISSWQASHGEKTIQRHLKIDDADLMLYSSWFCPFAQRAWITAEEAQLNYEWIEINPYEVDLESPGGYTKKALSIEKKAELYPEFVETSPRGLVPAIHHKDYRLWESLATAEYIDATFGEGKMAGENPYERARIQIWSAHCTERIQKQYYKALMSQNPESQKEFYILFLKECKALSNAMDTGGPYFLGTRFSLVDVALAPFWQRFLWIGGHYFGLTFPKEKEFDRLNKWWEACSKRSSVKNTFVCRERLIASYKDYSENKGTSDFAKNIN